MCLVSGQSSLPHTHSSTYRLIYQTPTSKTTCNLTAKPLPNPPPTPNKKYYRYSWRNFYQHHPPPTTHHPPPTPHPPPPTTHHPPPTTHHPPPTTHTTHRRHFNLKVPQRHKGCLVLFQECKCAPILRQNGAAGPRHISPQCSRKPSPCVSKCMSKVMFPERVCCSWRCAMPVQHVRTPEQARGRSSPEKNGCDKQVSSWRHISCHTDKNRYYT